MAGERLWQVAANPCRNKGGRPLRYRSPSGLWEDFITYCRWVDENPIERRVITKSTRSGDSGSGEQGVAQVRLYNRPLSLYGFCTFAGLPEWRNFKRDYSARKGFFPVISAIENAVATDQLDGAMLKLYDGNIVSRLLGLVDKTEINGSIDKNIHFRASDEQMARAMDIIRRRMNEKSHGG